MKQIKSKIFATIKLCTTALLLVLSIGQFAIAINKIDQTEYNIHIENAGENLRIAKKTGVELAKKRVIDEILYQNKITNINLNTQEIDSIVEYFIISNEKFTNNEYNADIKVFISPQVMLKIIEENTNNINYQKQYNTKQDIKITITTDKLIEDWIQIKTFLKHYSARISKITITKNEISIQVQNLNLNLLQQNLPSIAKKSQISDYDE